MHLVETTIDYYELVKMADGPYQDVVRGVIDIQKGAMVLGANLHADAAQFLTELGSYPDDLWGFDLYPAKYGTPGFIVFNAPINVRPKQNNRSQTIEDETLRSKLAGLINQKILA